MIKCNPDAPAVNRNFTPPALIGAADAAALCGISRSTWWSQHAQGGTPAPVKLGGRTLWRRAELLDWIEAGCPNRDRWEALRGGKVVSR